MLSCALLTCDCSDNCKELSFRGLCIVCARHFLHAGMLSRLSTGALGRHIGISCSGVICCSEQCSASNVSCAFFMFFKELKIFAWCSDAARALHFIIRSGLHVTAEGHYYAVSGAELCSLSYF